MRTKLRLDPWPAEQEGPVQIEEEGHVDGHVDPCVETAVWREIVPPPSRVDEAMFFVDGVRRIDARILAGDAPVPVHGVFGSIGAGCVRVASAAACFDQMTVERYLVLGDGLDQQESVAAGNLTVQYQAHSIPENSPADALSALQQLMRAAESRLSEALARTGARVFQDGPLSYLPGRRHNVVGVIKRLHLRYLDAAEFALVPRLEPGARTPLFLIRDTRRDRYSCFLRLARGRGIDHPLAGVVRLEINAALGLERAREMADFSSAHLPRFASTPVRDDRAPQNLLPVGALEQELRRRLGDPLLIRRAIESHLWREAA